MSNPGDSKNLLYNNKCNDKINLVINGCNSIDGNGNSIKGKFLHPNDRTTTCINTCLHATSQDTNWSLNDPFFNNRDHTGLDQNEASGSRGVPIGERGVTLYENFGLDEIYQDDGGLFSIQNNNSTQYTNTMGDLWNNYMLKRVAVQNHGRKVVLCGNIEFALNYCGPQPFTNLFLGVTNGRNATIPRNSVYKENKSELNLNALPDPSLIPDCPYKNSPFLSGWFYRIKFDADSINPDSYYKNNGNSYCRIHSYSENVYMFEEKTFKTATSTSYKYGNTVFYYYVFDPNTKTLWIDATFWFIGNKISGNELVLDKEFRPSSDPTYWNIRPGYNTDYDVVKGRGSSYYSPCPASPVSMVFDLFNDWTSTSSPFLNNNALNENIPNVDKNDISQSGFKSLYVPPHMEVQGFYQAEYTQEWYNMMNHSVEDIDAYKSIYLEPGKYHEGGKLIKGSDYRLKIYNFEFNEHKIGSKNNSSEHYNSLPLTYDKASEQNGAFHTLGTNQPNSMKIASNDQDIYSSIGKSSDFYSSIQRVKAGNTAGMFCGAVSGIKVAVRTTPDFYKKYVQPVNDHVIPEIFLNPYFYNARNDSKRAIDSYDPITGKIDWSDIQQIKDDISQSWDNSSKNIQLNNNYKNNPWKVIPTPELAKKKTNLITPLSKIYNFIKKSSTMITRGLILGTYDDEMKTSNYRITKFDPINGIYNLEWIYVIYYCGIQTDSMVSYDSDKGVFNYNPAPGDQNNSACRECMLYSSPKNANPDISGEILSTSVSTFNNYCGLRNFNFYYAGLLSKGNTVVNNECSCQASTGFCPITFDCSKDQTYPIYKYIGDDLRKDKCEDVELCSYCETKNIQITAALADDNSSSNTIKNTTNCQSSCSDSGSGSSSGSSSGSGSDPGSDPSSGSGSGSFTVNGNDYETLVQDSGTPKNKKNDKNNYMDLSKAIAIIAIIAFLVIIEMILIIKFIIRPYMKDVKKNKKKKEKEKKKD